MAADAAQAPEGALHEADYRGARVCVIVPDLTRQVDVARWCAPQLAWMRQVGVADLRVMVALGLHRRMTPAELAPLAHQCARYGAQLMQHDPQGALVTLSEDVGLDGELDHDPGADAEPTRPSRSPLPAALNAAVVEADRRLCVGLVEPHQYAGCSGGIKAISIGCASAQTIGAMHGLTYLRDARATLGRIQDNPFQAALWRVAAGLGPCDALQIVPEPGRPEATWWAGLGPARQTFERAAARSNAAHYQDMPDAVAWMWLKAPPAKAANFYQASRAATYAALVQGAALRPGGWLLLEAACPEGVGAGAGEQACEAMMLLGLDALWDILDAPQDQPGDGQPLGGGPQRALVLARALRRARLALIGASPMRALAAMGIPQYDSLKKAMDALGLDPRDGLRVHEPLQRVPRLASHVSHETSR